MKMYACGWKKDKNTYTVQINQIAKNEKKQIITVFKDWTQNSVGWNIKNDEYIVIFSKEFKDQKDWLQWAKSCPIELTELRIVSGKEKKIQLSKKRKEKSKK